jgi:GxxExxY protein
LPVLYKVTPLSCGYRIDFVCYEFVLVELKALSSLTGREYSQVMNYLKASGFAHALLFNFGAPRLEFKRLVLGPTSSDSGEAVEDPSY